MRAEAGVGGINPSIRKEEEKVVDTVLAGELSKPLTPYCRYGPPHPTLLALFGEFQFVDRSDFALVKITNHST